MKKGLERILTLTFGAGGNEATHLGAGWSADEPGHRWMIGQASEVWLENPGPDRDLILELDVNVLVAPPVLDAQRLVLGVRNQGISQISVTRPGTVGFHIPVALVEKPGPVRLLFVHPDFRRPKDLKGSTDDRELSFSLGQLRLSRVLHRSRSYPAPELPPDQTIMRFESLGDNCEFGLVQRRLGAEPLGLLRFSFIEMVQLVRGLRLGFQGLGDPGTTEVSVDGKDEEYVVRDTVFGMTYHTWQYRAQIEIETVRRQQTTRLAFLKRKLMEDVAAGEKIFVVKRANKPLAPEEVLPLYAVLNDLGSNWLLWVVPADQAHPAGTVDVLLPGLLRGYVDRFAPDDNAPDLSLDTWVQICAAAWRAAGT